MNEYNDNKIIHVKSTVANESTPHYDHKNLTGIDAIAYYLTITSFQPGVGHCKKTFRQKVCDVKNKLFYDNQIHYPGHDI